MIKKQDNRASESALAELHGAVAKILTARLVSGEASTADINAAIKFLKDNSIECVGEQNDQINDILKELPTFLDKTNADSFTEPDNLFN